MKCFGGEIDRLLNSRFFPNQCRAHNRGGYRQIKVEYLPFGRSVSRLRSGGFIKYSFSLLKASSHSSLQEKAFLKILKKGRHLSVDWEMNQLRADILPVSCCNCSIILGGCISRTVLTFSGLASFPLCDTINPKKFPDETSKAHFARFNFVL
jgi:hypothetical protein